MHSRYTIVDGVTVPIISGGDGSTEPDDALNADPEHGGVTDDALEAAIQNSPWGNPTQHDDAPAPEDGATTDDAPAGEAGTQTGGDTGEAAAEGSVEGATPPPAAEETPPQVDLNEVIEIAPGVEMTRADAARWASFQGELQENPELAQRVAAALRAGYAGEGTPQAPPAAPPAPPVDETPQPPEGLDLDDPQIAMLWQQHVDNQARYAQLEQRLLIHDEHIANTQRQTTESLINTARTGFQEKHHLSDTEMQNVYDLCGELQVLPALLSTTDPATGQPRQVDPIAAMDRAFDIARWQIPELRQREIDAQLEQAKTDTKRKKKLTSLGGSSGSAPRTTQVPNTPAGRREAMIREVAGMMTGQGANE